jgi:hypothetical protein
MIHRFWDEPVEGKITFCVGYQKELVMDRFPDADFFVTYDENKPRDVVATYPDIFDAYPDVDHFIILFGDAVWSIYAFNDFVAHQHDAPLVFYHDPEPGYTETFALSVSRPKGTDIIQAACKTAEFDVIPQEIRTKGWRSVPLHECRTGNLEMQIDKYHSSPDKLRVPCHDPVDDIDLDEDIQKVRDLIAGGKMDVDTY